MVEMATGYGPFDAEVPLGLSEFGGGAGLVEGSPTSQSGKRGIGVERIASRESVMPVEEKIGVVYRTDPRAVQGDPGDVDPQTGLTPSDVE